MPDGTDELGNGEKREEDVGRVKAGKLWGKGVGRWCKKCGAWKPPRCHHCRKCGRCVLRMDHHCGCIFSSGYLSVLSGLAAEKRAQIEEEEGSLIFFGVYLFTTNFKKNPIIVPLLSSAIR